MQENTPLRVAVKMVTISPMVAPISKFIVLVSITNPPILKPLNRMIPAVKIIVMINTTKSVVAIALRRLLS